MGTSKAKYVVVTLGKGEKTGTRRLFFNVAFALGVRDVGTTLNAGGMVRLVVRALAFHQCGPGSISALGVIFGLSLLVLYSAPRVFSPGTPVFSSHQKTNI